MLTVHVLGPVEVRRDGVTLDLGGPQQRAVIAHLALDVGRVVPVERLIDRVWGDDPPRTPLGTLQSYVSRLRRAIEPSREAGTAPQILVSEAPGYVLRLEPEAVDVHRFATVLTEARSAAAAGYAAQALERFDAALDLWRGPPLAGIGPEDEVRSIVVRYEEERALAIEDRSEMLLALGRHTEAIPSLQAAVEATPLRERLWALYALALYRSSRQAEALRALTTAREHLLDELGLDPGPELQKLETRILAQDPALLATPDVPAPVVDTPARPARPSTELVGRSAEWGTLDRALDRARSAGAQMVLLEGEPGIGKSTLSEAFLTHARAQGWRTAVGRCVESGLAPSLWPAIEVVRSLIADSPRTPTAAGNALYQLATTAERVPLTLSPVELVDQFADLLDALQVGPAVVLIDDLHWADRVTLDVLALVAERLRNRPLVVLAAHRPPELAPGTLLPEALGRLARAADVHRVSMSPLSASEVARLIEITIGSAPSAAIADRVQARAGGNPLFVAELARLAGERGITDVDAVPDAIRDVVRGRLAQLPATSTSELQVAATIGERFDLRTVIAASERDADSCLDALDSAIVTRILVPDGDGYRFAHALVRDAVLAQLTPLRRSRLHLRVAEALRDVWGAGPDYAEPIAHHRLAAGNLGDLIETGRAAAWAADVARWRGALDASEEFAERALEVLSTLPRSETVAATEIPALESLASVALRRLGNDPADLRQGVGRRVLAFAERLGHDGARALGLFLMWDNIDERDDLRTLDDHEARELAERTTDPYAQVVTHYMAGALDLLVGRLDSAQHHLDRSLAAVGGAADDRPEHVPVVLVPVVAGIAAAVRGDAEAARLNGHRRTRAWLAERVAVDATAEAGLAFAAVMVEAILDEPGAVRARLEGVALTDANGFFTHQSAACELLDAWARVRLGDPGALADAELAMTHIERSNEQVLRSPLRTFLGAAMLEAGDARAIETLTRARAEADARGEVWWLSETIRLRALAERAFGDAVRAEALLDEAAALAEQQGAGTLLERIAASRPVS